MHNSNIPMYKNYLLIALCRYGIVDDVKTHLSGCNNVRYKGNLSLIEAIRNKNTEVAIYLYKKYFTKSYINVLLLYHIITTNNLDLLKYLLTTKKSSDVYDIIINNCNISKYLYKNNSYTDCGYYLNLITTIITYIRTNGILI